VKASSNFVRGTVDLMVLKALEHGPAHGLQVARWIREGSGDVVSFEDAALYQSLHRLERRGMVTSEWGRSDRNRRARFYRLTAKGRRRLVDESEAFRALSGAIVRLLRARGA
jgi:transcriptional regulator